MLEPHITHTLFIAAINSGNAAYDDPIALDTEGSAMSSSCARSHLHGSRWCASSFRVSDMSLGNTLICYGPLHQRTDTRNLLFLLQQSMNGRYNHGIIGSSFFGIRHDRVEIVQIKVRFDAFRLLFQLWVNVWFVAVDVLYWMSRRREEWSIGSHFLLLLT